MKIIYYIPFILFTVICLIFFSNKSHAVDVYMSTGNLYDLQPGQVQHIDFNNVEFFRILPDEFHLFTENPQDANYGFYWYGQPGSQIMSGSATQGDLSPYTFLISQEINSHQVRQTFLLWFETFPSVPYPDEDEEEEEEEEPSLDGVNSEVLQMTILTISMTAFSIFGFTTGMTFRFDS
jgi:hypothetical protein